MLSAAILHVSANAQRLAEKRMPAIVNRYRLKMMCIMPHSTGVGESFIAAALAQKACRDGYSALYTRAAALFRDFALARADGSFRHLLARISRIDVVVVDDWAMAPLTETERRDFWEVCEERYQTRSVILTSQMPVTRWHEQIGDPTVADGILDRLVHNAHRIEMRGDSMRKGRGVKPR